MNRKTPTKGWVRVMSVLAGLSLLPALLITPSDAAPSPTLMAATSAQIAEAANAQALTAPASVTSAPLPGAVSSAFSAAKTIGVLTTTSGGPQTGVSGSGTEGQPLTITGSGLPQNATVTLDWSTNNATWVADVEPSTANYLGMTTSSFNVTLGTATTDATGNLSYKTTVPVDFGGVHNVYAVVNGTEDAVGGFTLLRTITISPTRGPIGSTIHVTVTGLGETAYTTGDGVNWDNHMTGLVTALWTRGTASFTLRAAGPLGKHTIEVGSSLSTLYMNPEQSPVPYAGLNTATFTTTAESSPAAATIDLPADFNATPGEYTTLSTANLDPASSAVANLSVNRGPVGSQVTVNVTGLSASGTDQLEWSSVVGSRVNCPNGSSSCWQYASTPLGSASVSNGTLSSTITVPTTNQQYPGAGLGGWHVIQVINGSKVEAEVPYYVQESVVVYKSASGNVLTKGLATAAPVPDIASPTLTQVAGVGTPTLTYHEGQEFTVAVNGVGWTQVDNTLAVDYDNSLVGYGCGFNSNGYMVVHLYATGGLGTHIIDLYPQMYTLNPSFTTTAYGMTPILDYGTNYLGLALGYQIPAIHLAIRVVK
ncbi:MAG: hypothetical protein WCA31_01700 [Acidimicrobiales bacterium]